MSEHIIRMKIELEELQKKIKKGKDFLNKEKNKKESEKILDDNQRVNLAYQLMQMDGYARTLEERIKYDAELKNKKEEISVNDNPNIKDFYEDMTSDKYAKYYGFKNWEDFEENANYHIEPTLIELKAWFLEDMSIYNIIKILEGKLNSDYNDFVYLTDLDRWIYKYN